MVTLTPSAIQNEPSTGLVPNAIDVSRVGIVIIGRNEGERLKAAIRALEQYNAQAVYVDSGSTDGSVDFARSAGLSVVNLEMDRPFTAARARNAGFKLLHERFPQIEFVQFVDGDCVTDAGWLPTAIHYLDTHKDVAVLTGYTRELYPDASIYNWICNIEWNRPAGETDSCGGNAFYRVAPFAEVTGFRDTLICGEEPELCIRLRDKGWKIWRLADDMTRHDAAIHHFSKWWKRAERNGYAVGKVVGLHGNSPNGLWKTDMRRMFVYALVIPLIALGGFFYWPIFLVLLYYPLQIARIAAKRGIGDRKSWAYASLLTLSKFAEFKGLLLCWWDGLFKRERKIFDKKPG